MTDTSKLRPTSESEFVALLNDMADRKRRHDYSIGHYWNAVDEAADHIQKLKRQRDELAEALEDYRDAVLNQRGALAENGMTNDQINDVLREFDNRFGDLTHEKAR